MEVRYKIILVLILLVIISINGCKVKTIVPPKEKLDYSLVYSDYLEFEECINIAKNDKRYQQIISGEISVIFDKKMSLEEINSILKDFNLNISRKWPGTYYHTQHISVPRGTEYYWICKFKNLSNKVKEVSFDIPLTTDV